MTARRVNYPRGCGKTVHAATNLVNTATLPAPQEVLPTQKMETVALPLPARAGQRHAPGQMNKMEASWAEVLAARQQAGEITWFRFECLSLKLAADCRYNPDFLVQMPDGTLELHETKGFMRDDAAVKLKICAEMYPFTIRLVRRVKGAWIETLIGRKE